MKKLEQTARDAINGKITLSPERRRGIRTKLIQHGYMNLAWMLDSVS